MSLTSSSSDSRRLQPVQAKLCVTTLGSASSSAFLGRRNRFLGSI